MIPFYNFLKIPLLSGWSDEEIHQQFRDYNLPVARDEISKIRAKLQNQDECRKMIAENQQRHLNHEEGYVNKIVVNEFSFQSDTTSLISEITRIKNLSELEDSKFTFITLLSMEDLRVQLENMLLLYNSPMLVYEFMKQQLIDEFINPLSCVGQLHITDQDIRKYCYFFWNVLKSSQRDFSQYLKEKKELGFYKNHLDPLLERDFRVITGIDQNNIIFRKNNKLIFKHLNNIIDYLNEDKIPLNGDIEIIKTHCPQLKKQKIAEDIFQEIFSYAEHQKGLELADNADLFAPSEFMVIPQYNLIRLLLYCGFSIKQIKSQFKMRHFNPIPEIYLQKILEGCISFPEGRKMIEKNSKRLPDALKKIKLDRIQSFSEETEVSKKSSEQPLKQEFYNSKVVRETFEFPEFYDAVIKNPASIFSCFEPLNDILSMDNESYTANIEILLFLGKDLDRINKYWKDVNQDQDKWLENFLKSAYALVEHTENQDEPTKDKDELTEFDELTEDQLKIYNYYFWNITDHQDRFEEDIELGLYNYLALDPSNKRYEQHQWLVKSSEDIKILNCTGLANIEEDLIFNNTRYNSIMSKISDMEKIEVPKMLVEELKIYQKKNSKYVSHYKLDPKQELLEKFRAGLEKNFAKLKFHGEDELPVKPLCQDEPCQDDPSHPIQDEPYLKH